MAEIETPCVGVCIVEGTRLCVGCGRSLDEIAGWIGMTAGERSRIMAQLPSRRAALREQSTAPALLQE